MATLRTRWLLSILLVELATCFSLTVPLGPPAPPSPPECSIPCDEISCSVDIYCTWDPKQEPQIPTKFILHWDSKKSGEEPKTSSTNIIHREHFRSHDKLHVWVQATNQYGSAKSQEAVFNTADIFKPLPPEVTSIHHGTLEIHWNSSCDQLKQFEGHCNVRYRTEVDQDWLEADRLYGSYTVEHPQKCIAYEFQVRCACHTTLTSNWSAIHRILGIETIPVGELDVWKDCGIFPTSSKCVLAWKRLPTFQACGHILGYLITLSCNNGTAVLVNVSTAEPRDQLVCDEVQCYFTSSLKDVSSANVSAYNAHGTTRPSYLAMPRPGKEKDERAFHIKIDPEHLNVSWDLPSQPSDNLKEYVVQYKQAGRSPGQEFDWVKLNKSQTTAFFIGQFKNYTPYQVSLFTVSQASEVRHLSSVIGYSLQRPPSSVRLFKVLSLAANHVTLLWEPVPLNNQGGVILFYQIGVNRQNTVYNVSALPQHENRTFQLLTLSAGHKYEVWIRAVTAAGPGKKTITMFTTQHQEHFDHLPVLTGILCPFFLLCLFFFVFCICYRKNTVCPLLSLCYCDKAPDPRNSHIFRDMEYQMNDSVAWICIPTNEPHPKISLLEIGVIQSPLEKTSDSDRLTAPIVRDRSSQMDSQDDVTEESHGTDQKRGREAYSKMVDSDEERSLSSSEEEQCTSGYEKHFMPTVSEILEVSSCLNVD